MIPTRALADLLFGCACGPCRARDAFRHGRWTAWSPPSTMSRDLQWLLYGYAVIERLIAVH